MDRLGVGYGDLKEVNERICYCSISGYGQDGPMSTRAGHDINYMVSDATLILVLMQPTHYVTQIDVFVFTNVVSYG